jgi:aspartate aminotransferase
MLSERVRRIGHSATLHIRALADRLRAEGLDVLDLSAGQPDFPTPEPVKQAGKRAIDENRTRYTANEGIAELRRAIARKLDRDNGLRVAPDQILVSPGAKMSLYLAAMALLDPGDEVLIPTPHWVSYPEQVRLAGARPVFLETREEEGFKLSPGQLDAAISSRTRSLILNYPSNPTGSCYSRDELRALADVCVRRGLWVIADEIYEKLVYDGMTFTSIASLGPEIAERCVVVNGMSKAYSMTGWRIGYAAGPREVIAGMNRLQSHITSSATSIAQWASVDALEQDGDEIERRRGAFQRRRDVLYEGLIGLPGVSCYKPDGGFYLFPNVSGLFGRRPAREPVRGGQDVATFLLEQARVAVVPGEAFGSPCHVRMSYADTLDRVREGAERVSRALRALAG